MATVGGELLQQVQRTSDWLSGMPIERFDRPAVAAAVESIRGICQQMVELQCQIDPNAYGQVPVVPVVKPAASGAQLLVIGYELLQSLEGTSSAVADEAVNSIAQELRSIRSKTA